MRFSAFATTVLLVSIASSRVMADDEVELNEQRCQVRLMSSWSTSPIEAHNDVQDRFLGKITALITHRELDRLSADDIEYLRQQSLATMDVYDERYEERPRAYGTLHRTTLTASCPSQAFHRLEYEWRHRSRRKSWGTTSLILVTPIVLMGAVAGFIQLDRRSLGDHRWLLAFLGLLSLITCGAAILRVGQFL